MANHFDDIGSEYSLFESNFLFMKDLGNYGGEGEGLQNFGSEENLSRINVWIINEEEMAKMIPKIIKPEDLENTFCIIVPDTEAPWDIMNQCNKWAAVLKEQILKISPNLSLQQLEKLKGRLIDLYKTYEEPELDKDGKILNKKIKLKPEIADTDNDIDMSIVED